MRTVLLLVAGLMGVLGATAQTTNDYTVSNIITSAQDSRLINPWGLSRPSSALFKENEWWINNQVTGISTLYYANGTTVDLAVTIPSAIGSGTGSPTGTAFDPTNQYFAFSTLDGTISAWNPRTTPAQRGTSCMECHVNTATVMVNNGAAGASYQGLTIAKQAATGKLTYYAANANGGIEAYDAATFAPVTLPAGAFTDPQIPSSYTPAGIQQFLSALIFVTYNASAGGGTGFVNVYDTNGKLVLRLQRGWFNQPWGVAVTPSNFGKFSNMILVGNTGNGFIGVYGLTGLFQGYLKSGGKNITLPGLWGLEFGNGSAESGPTNVLYFNTGGLNQTTGVFGSIKAN